MRRRAVIITIAIAPLCAHAQGSARLGPLSIPEGQILRCTRADPPARLRAIGTEGREFRIGPPEDEVIGTGPARARVITVLGTHAGRRPRDVALVTPLFPNALRPDDDLS